MIEPQSVVLARLCVMCILATMEQPSSTGTKKRRSQQSDSEDMDTTGPVLKSRKLNPGDHDNCSNDFVFDTSSSVHREAPVYINDPLQTCLHSLFKTFAQFVAVDDLSPKVYFIFQFLSLLVQCGKDRIKPVLKLLPPGLVQNLLKVIVTDEFTAGFILRFVYDL